MLAHKCTFTTPGDGSCGPVPHRMRGVQVGENTGADLLAHAMALRPKAVSADDNRTMHSWTSAFARSYRGFGGPASSGRASTEKADFTVADCLIPPVVGADAGSMARIRAFWVRRVPQRAFLSSLGAYPFGAGRTRVSRRAPSPYSTRLAPPI
jgi:hypothetical protein